jgi:hypothetical protein
VRTGVPVAMLGIQRGGNCVEGSVHPRSDPGVLFAHVAAGSLLSGMEHSATLTVHCEDSAECASSAWCSDTGAIPNGPMRAGDAEDAPCVYALLLSVASRRAARPASKAVDNAPTAVKDSSIAFRTNAVALGILFAATSGIHRIESSRSVGDEKLMPHVSMPDSPLQGSPQQLTLAEGKT